MSSLGRSTGGTSGRRLVVALTTATMIVEIVGGSIYGSMAVVATAALPTPLRSPSPRPPTATRAAGQRSEISFGTGKLRKLAAYSSATILALVAVAIGYSWPDD